MRTNIDIDDDLLQRAQKVTNIKTKKGVVEKALQVLVQLENPKKLLDLWGKVEFDKNLFP